MFIILFLIILSVLVIVHELGHFSVAKSFGVRVDEFGLGYPPKAKKLFSWRGTDFTLNWLPFGGFVKIFGEDPNSEDSHSQDNLQSKNRGIQALVLLAGVVFNFIFAWLLISGGLLLGLETPAGLDLPVENPQTVITTILPGSPADLAGVRIGDALVTLSRGKDVVQIPNAEYLTPAEASDYIANSAEPLVLHLKRAGESVDLTVVPSMTLLAGRPAIGIAMEVIGTTKLSFLNSIWQGLKITSEITWLTAKALLSFIVHAVTGRADLSAVSGPVGLAGMVGEVSSLGIGFLISFVALISINLAVLNLVPFPALDGGRLLFILIESVTRRSVPPRIFNAINTAGFAILIFLMILVTFHDVRGIL